MKIIFILTFLIFINIIFADLIDLSKITDITKEICNNLLNEQKELANKFKLNKDNKNFNKEFIIKKVLDNGKILINECKDLLKTPQEKLQEEMFKQKQIKEQKQRQKEREDIVRRINNGECVYCKNDFGEDSCMKHIKQIPFCPRKEFNTGCIVNSDCRHIKSSNSNNDIVCDNGKCIEKHLGIFSNGY